MIRKLAGLFLLCGLVIGCSGNVAPTAPRGKVTGKVTGPDGAGLSGVNLFLQPTGDGQPANLPLQAGAFSGDVVPGKYTWYIAADPAKKGGEAGMKNIPAAFKEGSMERQMTIKAGDNLELQVK